MPKKTSLTVLLAVAAFAVPSAFAQVAKVNGVAIPQSRADILLKEVTSQGRPDSPELRTMIKQELVSREVMAQEAVKMGLNKNPEVSAQLDIARQADVRMKVLGRLLDHILVERFKQHEVLLEARLDACTA